MYLLSSILFLYTLLISKDMESSALSRALGPTILSCRSSDHLVWSCLEFRTSIGSKRFTIQIKVREVTMMTCQALSPFP